MNSKSLKNIFISYRVQDTAGETGRLVDDLKQHFADEQLFMDIDTIEPGVHPRIMGIGPVAAIPKALKQANMNLSQIDLVELNEAFASQALAVIREAGLDPETVNINGGAIALGHPLGCTGCKLTIQVLNDMKRLNKKYGMVTACVGGGQGIAGVIENIN